MPAQTPYAYDDSNIFAKILRHEIPCDKVYESPHSLAFNDINPQSPTHVLVIPKGAYVCYDDFVISASEAEIIDFNRTIARICADLNLCPKQGADGGTHGYRLITNAGADALQEVPHYHVHILGGRVLGPLLAK